MLVWVLSIFCNRDADAALARFRDQNGVKIIVAVHHITSVLANLSVIAEGVEGDFLAQGASQAGGVDLSLLL